LCGRGVSTVEIHCGRKLIVGEVPGSTSTRRVQIMTPNRAPSPLPAMITETRIKSGFEVNPDLDALLLDIVVPAKRRPYIQCLACFDHLISLG